MFSPEALIFKCASQKSGKVENSSKFRVEILSDLLNLQNSLENFFN